MACSLNRSLEISILYTAFVVIDLNIFGFNISQSTLYSIKRLYCVFYVCFAMHALHSVYIKCLCCHNLIVLIVLFECKGTIKNKLTCYIILEECYKYMENNSTTPIEQGAKMKQTN